MSESRSRTVSARVGTGGIDRRIRRHVLGQLVGRDSTVDLDQRTDDSGCAVRRRHANAQPIAARRQVELPADGNHREAATEQEAIADIGIAPGRHAIEHAGDPVAAVHDVHDRDAVAAGLRPDRVEIGRELDATVRVTWRLVDVDDDALRGSAGSTAKKTRPTIFS